MNGNQHDRTTTLIRRLTLLVCIRSSTLQRLLEDWRWHRSTKQIALEGVTAQACQKVALCLGLHAFGDHMKAQALAHCNDGLRHHGVTGIIGQFIHE